MSLTQDVALAIEDLGRATLDDLAPMFPEHTRTQVWNALKNARSAGLIVVAQLGKRIYGGSEPSTYMLKPPKPIPVGCALPSVWALAGGGVHIPVSAGQRYQPLGGWND